jgi:hypothetical protein
MFTDHPDIAAAFHLYEQAGFRFSGVDPKSQRRVYHFDF